jgi:hypothetical protein
MRRILYYVIQLLNKYVQEYKDKYILISGLGDTLKVALDYGFENVLSVHEYSALFPYLSPLVCTWDWIKCPVGYVEGPILKNFPPKWDLTCLAGNFIQPYV